MGIDCCELGVVCGEKSDGSCGVDVRMNGLYDGGYVEGEEDGYYDGMENIGGDC